MTTHIMDSSLDFVCDTLRSIVKITRKREEMIMMMMLSFPPGGSRRDTMTNYTGGLLNGSAI
jgi:hypothetical protein